MLAGFINSHTTGYIWWHEKSSAFLWNQRIYSCFIFFVIGLLIFRHLEWSSVVSDISALSSLLSLHFINERCACCTEMSISLQERITINHQLYNHMSISQLSERSSGFSGTLHERDMHGHRWQQEDLTSTTSWAVCWWLFVAALLRVNAGGCLYSRSLPGERKYLKLESSA